MSLEHEELLKRAPAPVEQVHLTNSTEAIGVGRRRGVARVRCCSSTSRSWVDRSPGVGVGVSAAVVVGVETHVVMNRMVKNAR